MKRPINHPRVRPAAGVMEHLEIRRHFSVYFVNAGTGSDADSGRSARAAWQSLTMVNSHSLKRGDRVYLTGTFTNQTLVLGPAEAGVSVNSYLPVGSRGAIRLAVPNAAIFSDEQADGIDIAASGITISNITIAADPSVIETGNYNYGIYLHNSTSKVLTRETINDVSASGFSYCGLCMQGWNGTAAASAGFSDVLIENSSFFDNQVSGLFAGAGDDTGNEFQPSFASTLYLNSNLTIKNCLAYDNAGANDSLMGTPDGVNINQGNFTAGGIFISSVAGAVVENCTVFDNCFASLGSVGTWTFDSTRVNFEKDESYDNKTAGDGDGDGFDFDHGTTDSIMQNDYAHGNAGFGFLIADYGGASSNTGDTIRDCASDDDASGGICALSSVAPLLDENIYNNTLLSNGVPAISLVGDTNAAAAGINVLNNILDTTGGAAVLLTASGPNMHLDRNDYWSASGSVIAAIGTTAYSSIADFSSATGFETVNGKMIGLVQDPLLVGETPSDLPIAQDAQLALSPNSPLRKEGLNLATRAWAGSSPFDANAPFNLAGREWGGLGLRNFFGKPISRIVVGAG